MVAAGEHGRAGGRAQRGGVELVVAQAARSNGVEARCVHRAAEGSERTKAHIVEQHEQDVGRRVDGARITEPPRR